MHVETAKSLFDMSRFRKFLEGVWGGHLQTRVGPAPYKWSRHTSIKMGGRSWHIFLLLVHSDARKDLMILINHSPEIIGLLRLYFPFSREKSDG